MKKIISALTVTILLIAALCSALQASAQDNYLPSSYNSDPENPMYMTSVKNQGKYGICWAFAAIACCESEAIKNHGANPDEINLSELHLAYFSYNFQDDVTGDEISTTVPFYEIGADSTFPIFTLSKWIGLVDESVASFEEFAEDPTKVPDESLKYGNNEYYIKNAYTFDYSTDIEDIKKAIMEYGAVQSAYFSADEYHNTDTSAYYCPSAFDINHAITIIGWDDNYSKDNFVESARPSSDGAWLVKNSWGENMDINGYFWLSFEDASITNAIAYDVEPAASFEPTNVYQHDGGFSLVNYEYESICVANIFQAKSSEELLSVSVFTFDANNTPYDLEIYVNPDNLTPEDFFEKPPVYEQEGVISKSGFETLDLTTPVILNEGDVFIVCIETSACIGFDAPQEISKNGAVVAVSNPTTLPNQTYIAIDNYAFYDTAIEDDVTPVNARIKAFTKNCDLGEATLESLPAMKSIEYGQSLKESALIGGSVIDSLHNTEIRGSWSFKDSSLIPENGDTVEVIFTPDNSHYQTFTKAVTAVVTPSSPIIELGFEKTSYSDSDPLKLTISLKNKYSDSIDSFGTVSYTYKIEDGEPVSFDGTLLPGKEMEGKKITITATVSEVDGKYLIATKSLSFTVPKSSTPNEDSQKETQDNNDLESETLEPTDTSDTQTDDNVDESIDEGIDESSDENIDESINESINESEAESIRESLEESVKESVKDKVLDSISCFSSASIPAIFAICALAAGITFKKKRH